jgi:hypothetical protein
MNMYQKRGFPRNTRLDVREREFPPSNRVFRRLANQFVLSSHHAAVVAELAGLGEPTR